METNNGQEAADRINQECIDAENERHRKWRELKLSGAALLLGNAIGEAIVELDGNQLAKGAFEGEMGYTVDE